MIELLAPAGSKEALTAAIESGADAVYLSGKMFGARQYAANFTDEQLSEEVQSTHLRGVSVYVTINTLIDNNEIPILTDYLKYLYKIGVDAVIVQDMGAAYLAGKIVPDMPLFASTQMTVHNSEGVKFLAELGFKRVILSRELSLDDIENISKNNPQIEIETFVHGAICISYSGQCLMSSMIGGRSGNRGRCAQPCRLPYELVDFGGKNVLEKPELNAGQYLLSPKDLNTLEILPCLIKAGVTSFKIEGRMKRPEYVAVVVNAYRRALDNFLNGNDNGKESSYQVSVQDKKDIAQIFNRDFTTAYLVGRPGRDMMSDRRPNNRGVMAGRVLSYDKIKKTVTIKLEEPLACGDIIEVWVKVGGRVNIPVSELFEGNKPVQKAQAGTEITISCPEFVRPHDRIFKVFDLELTNRAKTFFTQGQAVRRIPIDVTATAKEGEPLIIKLKDADGFTAEAATCSPLQKALNRPLTKESLLKQIERLGTTIFKLRGFTLEIEGEVMAPVSQINDARRRAVENLERKRLALFSNRPPLLEKDFPGLEFKRASAAKAGFNKLPDLVVNVDSLEKVKTAIKNGADLIMFGGENYEGLELTRKDYLAALELARQEGRKIIFNTPRIINAGQMTEISELIDYFAQIRPDGVGAANVGVIYLLKKHPGLSVHGDYPLNIYNNLAIQSLSELGLSSFTISPELNFAQIEEICNRTSVILESLVQGHLPVMVSEYCVAGSFLAGCTKQKFSKNVEKTCLMRKEKYWLKDRTGEKFPVVADQYCRMHVLNAKELSMLSHVGKLCQSRLGRLRIEGKYMDALAVGRITGLYRQLIDGNGKGEFDLPENRDITRGHYFRGVL